jgi:hypothetical protein
MMITLMQRASVMIMTGRSVPGPLVVTQVYDLTNKS